MGTYLGFISIRNNKFVNFKPLCEYDNGEYHFIGQYDRQALLPKSQYGDINFYYDGGNRVLDGFVDGEYILFDFETEELEDNVNAYGERNPTGYKVNLSSIDARKIKRMSEVGLFYKLSEVNIDGNYRVNPTLVIKDTYAYDGLMAVIVLSDRENTVLGPYRVSWREADGNYVIKTGLQTQKYVVWGYRYPTYLSSYEVNLGRYEDQQTFLRLDESICKKIPIDVITKEQLLASFKSTISRDAFSDGKLDLDNIGELLSAHQDSLFVGEEIPQNICDERFDSLSTMLTDEEHLNDTFGFISDTISDLLAKYQGNEQYNELVRKLAEDSDFMSKIQRFQIITDRIEEKQAEVASLTKQAETIQQQINNQKKKEYASSLVGEYEGQIQDLQEQKASKESEMADLLKNLEAAKDGIQLKERLASLSERVKYKEQRERELDQRIRVLSEKIDTIFANHTEKAMEFAFDGMLSNRMLQQAAEWESKQNSDNYSSKAAKLKEIAVSSLEGVELINYLVTRISEYRPNYDRNTILNILICYSQGFLTVFSGEPGTGKTSICKILGTILGLTLPSTMLQATSDGFVFDRLISVAVERGWTTKRDFIGYYNPLTKTFDRSNRRIFDALNILDIEAKENGVKLPFEILLDEANLSPMEYYWADYMNICDGKDNTSVINLGDNFCYRVPNHLRFVATINNDHTTESLSPRLIDRAWVIKLPKVKSGVMKQKMFTTDGVELISWNALDKTFNTSLTDAIPINGAAKEIYEEFVNNRCKNVRISVSSRADSAVRRYWAVAQKLFGKDTDYDTDPSIVALDYAISQRILPHIDGSGEKYGESLNSLAKFCSEKNLRRSAEILTEIVQKGEETMQYYQFFA